MKSYYEAVLYHADCPDGFGAAWVAWTALGGTAEYIPVRYNEPPPRFLPKSVLIVDFSYSRETLEKMKEVVRELVVLDHHKTAADDLKDFPGATFDMEHSGAWLAYKHFYPNDHVPAIVGYIEDRDLWRWELAKSREVSAWLSSYPFDFKLWDQLAVRLRDHFNRCVDDGEAILRAKNAVIDRLCENAGVINVGGHWVPVVNTQVYISEVANKLCENHPNAPFAACYFDSPGSSRKWSLRSTRGFDVSEIAKRYGGGGHPAAAGFSADIG